MEPKQASQLNEGDLVSVVIPVYNRAHLISEVLGSVLSQSYRPLEVLVVDDGSTDNTGQVVGQWQHEHADEELISLQYIRHQEKQGGNPARNTGIAHSMGQYVAFLDSDDLWHSDKLEKQMPIFAADPEIGGVYCGVQHVDLATGRVMEPCSRDYAAGWLLERILVRDVTAPTSTYVIRRGVFEQVGRFDTDLQARQDWDMWIRLASRYKIGCVPEVLVDYREHDGVRTKSHPNKEIDAYGRILGKYAHLLAKCRLSTRQAARASFYKRMGRVYFHRNVSTRTALGYYLRSVVSWPFDWDAYAALAGTLLPGSIRGGVHRAWNRLFGRTRLAIRSH